ncbi:DNA-processing protein DprA [Prevotella colorans]|uniref:DNA processing protein n=1 Tax=Hallella colorans TaxID=1703337 RepID=A0A2U0UJY8_9BACT|nr:DNA processing protein [Hallella colorans]
MSTDELINTAILTRLSYYHLNTMVQLYRSLGSATAIVDRRDELPHLFSGLPAKVVEALKDVEVVRARCEEELEYNEAHGIISLCLNDAAYPARLKECPDAPLMLFYKGTANLNARRIVNIVGTRHCTPYGEDLVRHLIDDLRLRCPDVVVVSGLAYGVDVCAHRNALRNGMYTIGVLAHGLDNLYPPRHRDVANEMVRHGGLLTEFMTHTNADKLNFVRRNRIVAGISDACVIVESAPKGGGLITTRISKEYNRDVFAFPGPVGAIYSEGCNRLIRDNGAGLITSADDLLNAMGWADSREVAGIKQAGIALDLFPELSENERLVVKLLQKMNDLQLNIISVKTGIPIGQLSSLLFNLEMKGIVKPYAGGTYHLLG